MSTREQSIKANTVIELGKEPHIWRNHSDNLIEKAFERGAEWADKNPKKEYKEAVEALNKIGFLCKSGVAHTREVAGRVEEIVREALGVEDKFPYWGCMSIREDQIMVKAKEKVINSIDSGMDEETAWIYGFYHGANWSDSNPESGVKASFDDLQGPGIVKLSLEDGRSLSIDLSKFVNEIGKLRGAIDIETNNRLHLLDKGTPTPEEIQKSFRELCSTLRELL